MNPDLYTKCVDCGRPILHRTAEKWGGSCAHCPRTMVKTIRSSIYTQRERFDPLDTNPEMRWLVEIVDAEAEREALGHLNALYPDEVPPRFSELPMRTEHLFWKCKKRILKEAYGIDWKSPADLNGRFRYD